METRNGDDPEEEFDNISELCDLVRDTTPDEDYMDRNLTMIGVAMGQLNRANERSLSNLGEFHSYQEGVLCLKLMKLIMMLEEG